MNGYEPWREALTLLQAQIDRERDAANRAKMVALAAILILIRDMDKRIIALEAERIERAS